MKESQLQRVYNYIIYPRVSKVYSDKRFVYIGKRSQGGTHWNSFIEKETNQITLTRLVVSLINFC